MQTSIFLLPLFWITVTAKSFNYSIPVNGDQNDNELSIVRNLLERLEEPAKKDEIVRRRGQIIRRLHGVSTLNRIDTPPIVLNSRSDSRGGSSGTTSKKRRRQKNRSKYFGRKIRPTNHVVDFEQKLARQIEEDQLKFVEDEKNPMKYVVENNLLYKQSRFLPLARIDTAGSEFNKATKKKSIPSTLKNNVFRGNYKQQTVARQVPKAFATVSLNKLPDSFTIDKNADNSSCSINRYGFICCDPKLESIIEKSYAKLKRRHENADLTKIANTLQKDIRSVFSKKLEIIVSPADFGTSLGTDFSCKTTLAHGKFYAMAFVPKLKRFGQSESRRQKLPYHELSRNDIMENADLVVSKNGIVVSSEEDIVDISSTNF